MKSRRISLAGALALSAMLFSTSLTLADDTKSQPTDNPQATQPAAQPDSTPSEPSKANAKDKKSKSGGKKDVDAIGNRDIGKRGMGNWYSLEKEIRLGKEYAQERAFGALNQVAVKIIVEACADIAIAKVGKSIWLSVGPGELQGEKLQPLAHP